jgi:hypothetical protein
MANFDIKENLDIKSNGIAVSGTTSVYVTVTPTVGGTPQSRLVRTVLTI